MPINPIEIDASVNVPQPIVEKRTVAHDVELQLIPIGRGDTVKTAKEKILELLQELHRLQLANAESNARGEYVSCVVILNSVVSAIALEDALVEAGIPRENIAPIRGLSARSSRDVHNKLIVVGTAAIEVGNRFSGRLFAF